ncbi:hypothetical protein Dsin_020947 [Dipteronia sinensis]|uniref:GRF-type domain-containing protein n=1 Tax=Dipteronia sinensis TaxID=43782 RepID=A0AAE0AA94_9ROSI|nr:hypothetical protein Dsin_020947 [Dipteronia sinensis]
MSDGLDLGDLYPKCLSGTSVRRFTSWTYSNSRRRFWGCSNFRGDSNCGFFRWYGPPMCARSKLIIPGLLRRIRELEMGSSETNVLEANDKSYASVFAVVINEEVSYAGGLRRNWF